MYEGRGDHLTLDEGTRLGQTVQKEILHLWGGERVCGGGLILLMSIFQ